MERRPDNPETPRLFLTRNEFDQLIDEKILPQFEKLDKRLSEIDLGLYALTEMLSARRQLKERQRQARKERDQR